MTYQLTNLTVVTGASSGIGAEIARRLAARKARLLLTGRDAGALRAVAGSLDPAAPAAELVTAGRPRTWFRRSRAWAPGVLAVGVIAAAAGTLPASASAAAASQAGACSRVVTGVHTVAAFNYAAGQQTENVTVNPGGSFTVSMLGVLTGKPPELIRLSRPGHVTVLVTGKPGEFINGNARGRDGTIYYNLSSPHAIRAATGSAPRPRRRPGCRGRGRRGEKLVLVYPELFPDVDGQCLLGAGGDLPGYGVSEFGGETAGAEHLGQLFSSASGWNSSSRACLRARSRTSSLYDDTATYWPVAADNAPAASPARTMMPSPWRRRPLRRSARCW